MAQTVSEIRAEVERAKVVAMNRFAGDWGTRDVGKVVGALRQTIPGSDSPADAAAKAQALLGASPTASNGWRPLMTKLTKIDSQTYRIGEYVVFKTERGDWQMGKPIVADDPLGGGFAEGTVSYHVTLRAAKSRVQMRKRIARYFPPRQSA